MLNYYKELSEFYNLRKNTLSKKVNSKTSLSSLFLNNNALFEQNKKLTDYVNEFNLNESSKSIILTKEKNTKSDFLSVFKQSKLIKKITIEVPNFIYSEKETTNFYVILYSNNTAINKFIIPFNNCGKYIEKVVFNDSNTIKSLFQCKRNSSIKCFYRGNVIDNSVIISGYSDNNNIIFNTNHSYDSINIQYEPIYQSYFIDVDYSIIDSIKVKTTVDIEKLILNIY